jgi:hypothetical protein
MKSMLAAAAIALLAVTPALASQARKETIRAGVIGQRVFDLQDTPVGRLESFIDVYGTPGALISTDDNLRGRRILAPAEDLGWRADGGLLLALPAVNIVHLPRYIPGRPLPRW